MKKQMFVYWCVRIDNIWFKINQIKNSTYQCSTDFNLEQKGIIIAPLTPTPDNNEFIVAVSLYLFFNFNIFYARISNNLLRLFRPNDQSPIFIFSIHFLTRIRYEIYREWL